MEIVKWLPARYSKINLLKKTTNSSIYSAYDMLTKTKVAIKLISRESSFYQGVYEEFKILFQFRHPNLVEVTDYGYIKDRGIFYVMPYYEKIDPIEYCERKGITAFLNIFFQLLCGLQFLHQRGKKHGDLTLENLIVTEKANRLQVRISDFGLSSLIAAEKISDISGTAKYLAPELLSKTNAAITVQSDLYSLGIVLYEIVSGKAPFQEKNAVKLMQSHLRKDIPPLQPNFKFEEGIKKIIYKLLKKQPSVRYKNCREILKDLNSYIQKYKLNQEEDFFWENVLEKIRIEKKIGFNFYRKKQIDYLTNQITTNFRKKDKQVISIIGGKNNSLKSTLEFIFFELRNKNYFTVILDNSVSKKNFEETIKAQLPKVFTEQKANNFSEWLKNNEIKQLLIFCENCFNSTQKTEELFSFLEKHNSLKIVTAFPKNNIVAFLPQNKTVIYRMKRFSKEEMEKYLNLYFGNEVLPEKLKKLLLAQSVKDLEILNDFIDFYIEKGVIAYKNLQWYFRLEDINEKKIPPKVHQKFENIFEKLEENLKEFMYFIALWKKQFTLKEASDVLSFSVSNIADKTEKLKQLNLLIQPGKTISLAFPFLREIVLEHAKKSDVSVIREKIISYFEQRKQLFPEEEMLLFSHYAELKKYDKILSFAKKLYLKFKNDIEKLQTIGKAVFEFKEKLQNTNLNDTIFILNHYVWALEKSAQYNSALNVFRAIRESAKHCTEEKLRNDIFVRNLYFLNREKKFSETISIYEKNKLFFDKLSDIQRVQALQHLSFAFKETGNFSEQKKILTQILEICDNKKELSDRKAIALESLAFAEYNEGNLGKALELLKETASINEKLKNIAGSAFTRCRVANIYMEQYRYDKALKQIQVAERLMKKSKVMYPHLVINNTYGNLYLATCDFWKALSYFHKAYLLFREQNEDYSVPMGNKGFALNILGFYQSSIELTVKTIEFKKKIGQLNSLGVWMTNLAFAHYRDGRKKKADEIFEKIQKMEEEKNIPKNFMAHFYMADFAISERKYEKAKKHIDFLASNFEDTDTDETAILIHYIKAKYLFETNSLKQALRQMDFAIKKLNKIKKFGFENQLIYYLAYKIKKTAFFKNISWEDYNKYLKTAVDFISDISRILPTSIMQNHYKKKKVNAEILDCYQKEFSENEIKPEEKRIDVLESIEELTEIISKVTDKKKLFTKILQLAVKVTKAERGIILVKPTESDEPEIQFSYRLQDDSLADVISVSRTIIRQVLEKKKAVYSTSVKANKTFNQYQSFVNLKIESVVCLPLLVHNQVLGTVYLDSRSVLAFTPAEIKFLNIFAQIAASAIETSDKFCKLKEEREKLSAYINSASSRKHPDIIGNSRVMEELFRKIEQIAPTDVNVLIEGESGTGKELVAKEIHRLSSRKNQPFIPIDCGSLSEDIIESELFGHVRGAFTGALSEKKGLFEEANKGTLFLDEISNISLGTQAKLLRVIQEGEMKRLGENSIRKVDVRIIVASNIPLQKLVVEGKFRQDLYYRLSIFPITVPSLTEREGDIELLAQHFLQLYAALHHKNIEGFSEAALQKLISYDWPGNVRELQNEIERAVIMFSDIEGRLPAALFAHLSEKNIVKAQIIPSRTFNELVDDYKLKIIEQTFEAANRNWTKTAKMLGISRQNLSQIYKRLKKQM